MWDLIHPKNDRSASEKNDKNTVHLTSFVNSNQIEKVGNCLLFEIHKSHYDIMGKLYFLVTQFAKFKLFQSSVRFTAANSTKPEQKPLTCPKNTTNAASKNSTHHSLEFTCKGTVNDSTLMDIIVEPSINDADVTQYSQFWYFFIAVAVSWIGMAVVVSVGDAICFDLLGKRHELYGRQRLWGAVGFGAFSLLSGMLVDAVSGNQLYKNYSVIYFVMAAALLPDTMVSTCLEVKFRENTF